MKYHLGKSMKLRFIGMSLWLKQRSEQFTLVKLNRHGWLDAHCASYKLGVGWVRDIKGHPVGYLC